LTTGLERPEVLAGAGSDRIAPLLASGKDPVLDVVVVDERHHVAFVDGDFPRVRYATDDVHLGGGRARGRGKQRQEA
jgi:hypothetical protein